jgi:hypothetical protein
MSFFYIIFFKLVIQESTIGKHHIPFGMLLSLPLRKESYYIHLSSITA